MTAYLMSKSVSLSVCLSASLSQSSIVSKQLSLSSTKVWSVDNVEDSSYQLWSQCSTIKHIFLWPSNRQLH